MLVTLVFLLGYKLEVTSFLFDKFIKRPKITQIIQVSPPLYDFIMVSIGAT